MCLTILSKEAAGEGGMWEIPYGFQHAPTPSLYMNDISLQASKMHVFATHKWQEIVVLKSICHNNNNKFN